MPDPKMRILIVDDFGTMRRLVRTVLNHLGYDNLQEAGDGKQALGMLKKSKFDFVVSDWNMPNMTGLELVRAIRADPEIKDLPILMVTSEQEKSIVIETIQAGVNNYIVKPFTIEVFEEKMNKIFERLGK